MAFLFRLTSLIIGLGLVLLIQAQSIGHCVINDSPSTDFCNKRGQIGPYASSVNNQTVDNLGECIDLAFLYTWKVIAYNETSSLCTFIDMSKIKYIYTADNSSDTVFYSKDCVACQHYCGEYSAGINLVSNGGFENSTEYSGPWMLEPAQRGYDLVTPGYNSPTAMLLWTNDSFNDGATIVESIRVCSQPYKLYYLSFNFKFETLKPQTGEEYEPVLQVFPYDTGIGQLYFNQNTSWSTALWTLQQDDGFSAVHRYTFIISLWFNSYRVVNGQLLDRLYIDNVQLSEVTDESFPPATVGSNLISNGGFETGELGPWHSGRGQIVPASDLYNTTVPGNEYALQLLRSNRNYATTLSQEVSGFKVNTPYLFSFDFRTTRKAFLGTYNLFTLDSPFLRVIMHETDNVSTVNVVGMVTSPNFTLTWVYNGIRPVYVDNFSAQEVCLSEGCT